jgi:hypothetical protein
MEETMSEKTGGPGDAEGSAQQRQTDTKQDVDATDIANMMDVTREADREEPASEPLRD